MKNKTCLLTGSSGKLGKALLPELKKNYEVLHPSKADFDITKEQDVDEYFKKNSIGFVVHTAAMARMSECEKDPDNAFKVNSIGTLNIVKAIINMSLTGHQIRMLHISTDGVYESTKGNYSEHSPTQPYNIYGWSKLFAEKAVSTLNNYCIVRTRFFDPKNIIHNESATDIKTSAIEINLLAKKLLDLLDSSFVGIINVGSEGMSEYDRYKKYKPDLKKCIRADIVKNLDYEIAVDATMNIEQLIKFNTQNG